MPLEQPIAELFLRIFGYYNYQALFLVLSAVFVVLGLACVGSGVALITRADDGTNGWAYAKLRRSEDEDERRKLKRRIRVDRHLGRLGFLVTFGGCGLLLVYWVSVMFAVGTLIDEHETNVEQLAAEHEANVERLASALASATTEAELAALATTDIASVRGDITDHTAVTETLQVQLAKDPVWAVRHDLANAKLLFPAAAMELAHDASPKIRKVVAGKGVSPDVLTYLLHDPDLSVAVEAFQNTHTPLEARCAVIQGILESSERYKQVQDGASDLVDYCVSVAAAQ